MIEDNKWSGMNAQYKMSQTSFKNSKYNTKANTQQISNHTKECNSMQVIQ